MGDITKELSTIIALFQSLDEHDCVCEVEDIAACPRCSVCADIGSKLDRLRARLDEREGGQPVAYRIADDLEAVEAPDADGGYMWDARECADWIRENAHAYTASQDKTHSGEGETG